MSVINRIPLINEILSGLDSDQLVDLRKCINGEGGTPIFRSLKPISNEHLTTADYGVKPIQLELNVILGGMSIYEGYLIYTEEMCYVICYSGDANQGLNVLKVNVAKNTAEFVNGTLSILELRSELDDADDGAEIVSVIQEDPTIKRFKKVYVDELPQAVQEIIASHFDDEHYKVTLSVNELNNYIWDNLAAFINGSDETSFYSSTFSFLPYTFNGNYPVASDDFVIAEDGFIEFNNNIQYSYSDFNSLYSYNTNIFLSLNETEEIYAKFDYHFSVFDKQLQKDIYDNSLPFVGDYIIWTVSSDIYDGLKSAIIKDLLANMGIKIIPTTEEVEEKISEVPNVEAAPSGTIVNALGLDSNGKVVKGSISGGTKLYLHKIRFKENNAKFCYIDFLSTQSEPFTASSITSDNFRYNYFDLSTLESKSTLIIVACKISLGDQDYEFQSLYQLDYVGGRIGIYTWAVHNTNCTIEQYSINLDVSDTFVSDTVTPL